MNADIKLLRPPRSKIWDEMNFQKPKTLFLTLCGSSSGSNTSTWTRQWISLSHTHTLEKGSSWWVHWKSCKLRLVIKISMYLFYGIMRDVRVKEKFDWDFQSADQLLYCWALMNFQFFERNDGFVRHKTPSSIIDVNSIYFWIN